jgi:hypothetical protein
MKTISSRSADLDDWQPIVDSMGRITAPQTGEVILGVCLTAKLPVILAIHWDFQECGWRIGSPEWWEDDYHHMSTQVGWLSPTHWKKHVVPKIK